MKHEGKNVIITGGGRDIGSAVAIKLAAEGANIAINYFASSKGADATVEAPVGWQSGAGSPWGIWRANMC